MFKQLFSLVLAGMLASATLFAQEKITVSGTVTDAETGEPLMAVGIVQQGTTNGVISAMDGDYIIQVPKGAVLEFSSIGYKTVEVIADRDRIDVALSVDMDVLDEVVVVGYGVQKKSSLTGAVSSVKSEDLQARSVTNVNQALGGKTAGVQSYASSAAPGSKPSMQVRGIGSNGDSAPLYVIDGRIASDAGFLNPSDIESIEVLKDGASAAIYGAAAGNGVILITTKKGQGDGKVSFEAQIASQRVRRPHLMNAEQWADYWIAAGNITKDVLYSEWDGVTNTDWFDIAMEPSLLQKYSVNFQYGNDRSNLYISLSHMNNDGIVAGKSDVHKSYSGVINASARIKPWLEVGTNNVIEFNQFKNADSFMSAMTNLPILKPYFSYDELPHEAKQFADLGWVAGDENGYYSFTRYIGQQYDHPLLGIYKSINDSRSLTIAGTSFINLNPWPWLTFTSRLSYSLGASESYNASHAPVTWSNMGRILSVNASSGNSVYWQLENFATAFRTFGNHTVTAMLGQSYSDLRANILSASEQGDLTDMGFPFDDEKFLYFNYANPNVTKSIGGAEPSYTRKIAYFGRLSYDYKGKYLLQASLRADAADLSILPLNKRWGFFPAASAGWVVSKEPFMDWSKGWLNQFKLRASWGRNGNLASLGGFRYSRTVNKYGNYPFATDYTYQTAYAPTVTGNDNLQWETSEQLDLGADFAFFGNRLTLGADWYLKTTRDLIVEDVKQTLTAGFNPSPVNVGSMINTGVELEMGWQDHIGDFSYGVRGNLTTLKNRVTSLTDGTDRLIGHQLYGGNPITLFEKDMPAWYFYGYKYLGVNAENGDPVFETGDDGVLGTEDLTYLGKGIPDMTYGITLNAAWKGLDLVVFGSGVAGVDIFSMYNIGSGFTDNRLAWYAQDYWTPQNTTATQPRPNAMWSQLATSSFNIFDGSYFKIKQIQLGYSLPQPLLSKVKISNLRLYCSLDDFFTFSSYIGLDPEVVGSGKKMGIDTGYYPTTRKVMFGVNLTF